MQGDVVPITKNVAWTIVASDIPATGLTLFAMLECVSHDHASRRQLVLGSETLWRGMSFGGKEKKNDPAKEGAFYQMV